MTTPNSPTGDDRYRHPMHPEAAEAATPRGPGMPDVPPAAPSVAPGAWLDGHDGRHRDADGRPPVDERVPGQSGPVPTLAERRAADQSVGDLVSGLMRDVSLLMRQEVALAKAELTESAKRAGQGAGMLTAAAVAGGFALLFLSIALWWALGHVMDLAWSAVIVAVLWAIVAAILALVGRSRLKSVQGAPQTAETLTEIPPTINPRKDTP